MLSYSRKCGYKNTKLYASVLTVAFVFLIAGNASSGSAPIICRLEERPLFPAQIEKMMRGPDNQINIGDAALLLDQQMRPEINVQEYSRKIDVLADEVESLNNTLGGHSVLEAMDTVFKRDGFHYDFSPEYKLHELNHTVSGLLETKIGFCDSMTALYIAVAQRLGMQPHAVVAPGHIFVRITAKDIGTLNIDATSGARYSDNEYIQKFHITDKGIKSGAYLRTLSYREYLGVIMFHTAQDMRLLGTSDMNIRSKGYYDKAVELNPRDAEIAEGLRRVYAIEGKEAARHGNITMASSYHSQEENYRKKTEELGYVEGEDQ